MLKVLLKWLKPFIQHLDSIILSKTQGEPLQEQYGFKLSDESDSKSTCSLVDETDSFVSTSSDVEPTDLLATEEEELQSQEHEADTINGLIQILV